MVNGGTTKRCAHAGTQARQSSLPGLPTSARTRPRTPYATSARQSPGGESTGERREKADLRDTSAFLAGASAAYTTATRQTTDEAQCECAGRSVKLPRIGRVKMREELRFEGEITTVVVSNDGIRWYAAIGVDTKTAPPPKRQGDAVGIDMGVRALATLSDGTVIENPRALASALSALRRVDKAIARSRNTHGRNRRSARRQRMYERRRRVHARVTHLRHDFQHKATTAIAKRYARIGVETLNISGMMRNHRLSRAIADAGLSSFISMLEYKSELYGAEIAKIDRWYASSKVCSGCGNKKAELSLSMREYRCHACGLVMDRDENAAKNIETEAARSADSLNGRGDEVRPGHRVPSAASVKRLLEQSDLPARLERISAD